MKIDLHTHTNYSDGLLSPSEVVDLASERRVGILAITDHNVVSGIEEALERRDERSVKVISGIEISSFINIDNVEIHIVGLGIDPKSKELKSVIEKIAENARTSLNERLKSANEYFKSDIAINDLQEKTKGIPSTRHIAQELLERNYVDNIDSGMNLFLRNGPCFISYKNKGVHAKESIRAIHDSRGLAILAHLSAYKNLNRFVSFEEQENLVKELVSYNLDGIEIYIPNATKEELEFGEKIAKKYSLLLSGGSDFHDEITIPQNTLGFLDIPKEKLTVLEKL